MLPLYHGEDRRDSSRYLRLQLRYAKVAITELSARIIAVARLVKEAVDPLIAYVNKITGVLTLGTWIYKKAYGDTDKQLAQQKVMNADLQLENAQLRQALQQPAKQRDLPSHPTVPDQAARPALGP